MKDYSQNGEQKIILDYFQPPRWPYMIGTFLDIGANDGVTFSNSRLLALMGWKGALVEPSPAAFQKLLQNNVIVSTGSAPIEFCGTPAKLMEYIADSTTAKLCDGLQFIPAAITTADGPIDLYDSGTHLKKGDVALLSTTVPKEMDRWKKSGEQFTKTSVRGITFATLMKETGATHFDFISIDCEGADWSVLKQIELREVGCKMLCIEYNAKKTDEITFTAYCQTFGLKLIHKTYENLIFAR